MAQRGVYRSLFSALFDDPDFQSLPKDCRLLLVTIRQCKDAGPGAIFRYYPTTLSAQTGLTLRQVEAAMRQLQDGRWIEYDAAVVWVRNGLRYEPSMTLANPLHRKAIEKHLRELPKVKVVLSFCDYYQIAYPFEGDSIPTRNTETEPEPETEPETETEKPFCPAKNAGPATGILEWLNQKAGKHFRPVEVNLGLIRARLKDGVEPFQLKAIVSRKVREWGGTDQAKYLRPATLFNKTKCEQYLGELPWAGNGQPD